MFVLKKCCFIFSLRKGCLIISIFAGIKCVIKILLAFLFAYLGFRHASQTDSDTFKRLSIIMAIVSIMVIIFGIAEILSNVLLFKGTKCTKVKMLFPWQVLCVIDLVISTILFIAAIVLIAMKATNSEYIWTLFAEPFNILTSIYCHLVVHSYYKQLQSVAPSVPEITTPVPPTAKAEKLDSAPQPEQLLHVPALPPIQHPAKKPPDRELTTSRSNHLQRPGFDQFGSNISDIPGI